MSDFKPVNQPITPMSADPGEEFPFLHTITVVDRVVSVDKPELVQNNIKTETVTLNLDSEWDGLSCIINIGNDDTPTSLIWNGQPVTIPAELMTNIGTLDVSVVGYGDDGALRAVTKKADAVFTVVASGYVEGDEPLPDPTTILGQLTEAADRANQAAQNAEDSTIDKVSVTMLPTGSDPSGSVSDKTLSLNIPNGEQGPKGDPGIQGPKGDPGVQGPKGDPGDLTTVAHDGTLTGDGTSGNPVGVSKGTLITPYKSTYEASLDLNEVKDIGLYDIRLNSESTNLPYWLPSGYKLIGCMIVVPSGYEASVTQIIIERASSNVNVHLRTYSSYDNTWSAWITPAMQDSADTLASSAAALKALEVRVQALEAKANQ